MRKWLVLVLFCGAACGGCAKSEQVGQGFRDMGNMFWHFFLEPR